VQFGPVPHHHKQYSAGSVDTEMNPATGQFGEMLKKQMALPLSQRR
jgi:hypothetical protein